MLQELFEDLRGQWCVSLYCWAYLSSVAQQHQSLRLGEILRLQTRKILIRPFLPRAKSDSDDSRSDTGRYSKDG